ncbi:carbohydrate ABC transporter permease [Tabrizicola sp.]|jgi:sorbitol/mannitol transport system permease protein|uniref:carbohydrate ABC transporter permease n=1 Tax=Tabrizicola sp. TaxID=2005166 RepID=UPI0025D1FD73|nr:sugar ABC transporter permease [Tabrizicola sp.]MBY0349993.1 sugar ABC transporter permease [Tabrizicola sp.]MDK2773444.1 sugar ABC transporter permease [Tabrizicola sp.]
MSTQSSRLAARMMVAPSVILLLIWMVVPLAMTLYYSFRFYRLLSPDRTGWVGFTNYLWFFNSPDFWLALWNTLALVGGVLVITVVLGILIALLIDQPVKGQGFLRILVIAPFFVMPPVAASIWENLFMHPQNGLFSAVARGVGMQPILFLEQYPMWSVIGIVSWEWLPFATLILLTALQSLSSEQLEAAEMDGAGAFSRFRHIILPHMTRAITVVILIQTIFLLGIFGEIFTTTQGGPGSASTTLPYMIFKQAIAAKDIGRAAAGGIIAVILANIVAYFLMRGLGRNLEN